MSNFDQKEVIQRIEKRLVELGMSKDEFYELSGVSSASFSQWNTGKHSPTPKKLAAVAKALQVSADYLLTGRQKETPFTQEGRGLNEATKYLQLNPENRAIVDALIDQLLKGQSGA